MIRMLDDLDAEGAALGVRVDINSPMEGSGLADDARLRAHVETISELCNRGARVALLAHQGRPGGEEFTDLSAHAARLDELIDSPIEYSDSTFSVDARERVRGLDPGSAILLENTRFYSEEYMSFADEKAAETFLVSRLAPALDAYVNDAFATSHRRQPSIVGFPQAVARLRRTRRGTGDRRPREHRRQPRTPRVRPRRCESRRFDRGRPFSAKAGARGLRVDRRRRRNAFLLADGVSLGAASAAVVNERSHEAVKSAGDLLDDFSHRIYMPRDVAVERDGKRHELGLSELPSDSPAMDIGVRTVDAYAEVLDDAGTAILNGPAGGVRGRALRDRNARTIQVGDPGRHEHRRGR